MIERKGNYIDGNGMQMDYDEVLLMVQVAYLDKKNEMINILGETHPLDEYGKPSWVGGACRYLQSTRGQKVAQLGREFERIANVLHHLQALGSGLGDKEWATKRRANFSWWFNDEGEEE